MPLNNYIKSLQGGPPEEHHAFKTFLLIIGAVFAGYTASQFPPKFLLFFSTPLGQFITFMILGLGLYQTKNFEFVVYDSIVFVILLQMLQYISKEIFAEQKKSNNKKTTNDNKNNKEYTNIIMASNEYPNYEINNNKTNNNKTNNNNINNNNNNKTNTNNKIKNENNNNENNKNEIVIEELF